MSEASRLLHAGTDRERALLRAGADEEPSRESVLAAARVLGLAPRAAFLASLAALLARATKGSWSTTFATFVVAPVVVAGAVTVAVVSRRALPRAPAHEVAPPSAAAQTVAAPQATDSSLPPPPVDAPPVAQALAVPAAGAPGTTRTKKESAAATAPRGAQDADFAEQVRLVDRARALVAAGDASGALGTIDAYERRFPHGILAEEAALVRIQAMQARGDRAEAGSLARRFLAQYPESVHRSKVQWLLGDGTN
ncbi:MAG TPA: outer membrane protein assembly factor BamD [Polyangiaceae bacterium]|jgi:hypothetical protein|nr:outer membrane protein assembly factor BamD [Polyangiaceae bacterium]